MVTESKGTTVVASLIHKGPTVSYRYTTLLDATIYYTTPVFDTRKEAWAYASQFVMSHRSWAGSEGVIGNIRKYEERKEYELYGTIDLRQNERLGRPVSIEIRN